MEKDQAKSLAPMVGVEVEVVAAKMMWGLSKFPVWRDHPYSATGIKALRPPLLFQHLPEAWIWSREILRVDV